MFACGGGETPRENLAGTNAVGTNVVRPAQAGDIASKTFEAGFCGYVRSRRKSGEFFQDGFAYSGHGGQGGYVDDGGASGFEEMRPCRPASEETGSQIYSDHAIPGLIGFGGKHFARAATGIVDEHVQAAIGGER